MNSVMCWASITIRGATCAVPSPYRVVAKRGRAVADLAHAGDVIGDLFYETERRGAGRSRRTSSTRATELRGTRCPCWRKRNPPGTTVAAGFMKGGARYAWTHRAP